MKPISNYHLEEEKKQRCCVRSSGESVQIVKIVPYSSMMYLRFVVVYPCYCASFLWRYFLLAASYAFIRCSITPFIRRDSFQFYDRRRNKGAGSEEEPKAYGPTGAGTLTRTQMGCFFFWGHHAAQCNLISIRWA